MANSKSAKKRIEINSRNRLRNRNYKSSARTLIKVVVKILENKEKLQKSLNSVYSLIDKGVKKRVHHKNAAARMKSKLITLVKGTLTFEKKNVRG